MTPDDLDLINADATHLFDASARFGSVFYETLFDIAPEVRPMFPDDLTTQRGLLTAELNFLVEAASRSIDPDQSAAFLDRARDLGRRHAGLGVTADNYASVEQALIAVIAECVPDWSDRHRSAWTTLIRLVSDLMREGVDQA